MKRLFIVASLAIMAIACQKTEVQNEVLTPIGFNTEVGKATKAIVLDQEDYKVDQPFAVYAYSHQTIEETETVHTVMSNVQISKQSNDWKATEGSYYWPNDPRTKMNFYAYSPVLGNGETDKEINGVITHSEPVTADGKTTGGLTLTGYVHKNMFVDFMVSDDALNCTYTSTNGVVPVAFNHKMTQVVFNVKTSEDYSGAVFTIKSIKLQNIKNTANYNTYSDWTGQSGKAEYTVFSGTQIVSNTADADLETVPVTMIPQTIVRAATEAESGKDTYATETSAQMFEITYTIGGTGVAHETVVKHVPFLAYAAADATEKDTTPNWASNQKITYNVTIGFNEIKFNPTVKGWETASDSYVF